MSKRNNANQATHPSTRAADAADQLQLDSIEAALDYLVGLDAREAALVLEELRDDLAADLLAAWPSDEASRILAAMAPAEAADVVAWMMDQERDQLLAHMDDERARDIRDLLVHHPESAGGLMTTAVASVPAEITVGEAMERIRTIHDRVEHLAYVYVVESHGRLVGVVSFRDLVFHRRDDLVSEAMVFPPVGVTLDTDRETITDLVEKYHLSGVPVTDDSGVLVGVVTTDEVVRAAREEASEDFAVAVGTAAEDSVYVPLSRSVGHRLPWITFDLVLSTAVVLAISAFDDLISTFVVLAALMPLIARIGGDAGAQSLAVVIRGLAGDGIPRRDVRRILIRETVVGFVNGAFIGIAAGGIGYLIQTSQSGESPWSVAMAMFLAAWVNLILAGFFGAAIPFGLRRVGLDPALGSNLFLTTLTDLVGFAGFLTVARLLL